MCGVLVIVRWSGIVQQQVGAADEDLLTVRWISLRRRRFFAYSAIRWSCL